MALIPGTTYDIFATTGKGIFIGVTTDPNNPPPPVAGAFNLEVIVGDSVNTGVPSAPGYQGVAYLSTNGHVLTAVRGDYGIIDSGANNTIRAGAGNVSVLGASGDSLVGVAAIASSSTPISVTRSCLTATPATRQSGVGPAMAS